MRLRILLFVGAALACVGSLAAAEPLASAEHRFGSGQIDEVPDFQRHVLPLLTRLGCNGRACHGSFQGKGGFRLSLFGYDFKADLQALAGGNDSRVDLNEPADSLILLKPTEEIPHEGGLRFKEGGWEYRLLHRWIETKAQGLQPDAAQFDELQLEPSQIQFAQQNQKVQLRVIAKWSDGTSEDVTPLCRFNSNNEAIATVTENGLIQSVGPGDTDIIVFYDNGVGSVPVLRPLSDKHGTDYPVVETPTRIDQLVVEKLRPLGVVPSGLCNDSDFLRRVSVDLTGTLPSVTEVKMFLTDDSSDKRTRKIDELLSRPEHATWWTSKLCELLGIAPHTMADRKVVVRQAGQAFDWINRRIGENRSYDEIVAGIVLSQSRQPGQSYEDYVQETAAYFRKDSPKDFTERDNMPHFWSRKDLKTPEEKGLAFAYSFLGVRLRCAECHKHPFDQWTRDDFRQFTAFFKPIVYGRQPDGEKWNKEFWKQMLEEYGKDKNFRRQGMNRMTSGQTFPWSEVYIGQQKRKRTRSNRTDKRRDWVRELEKAELRIAQLPADAEPKKRELETEKLVSLLKQYREQLVDFIDRNDMASVDNNRRMAEYRAVLDYVDERLATLQAKRLLTGGRMQLAEVDDPRKVLLKWLRSGENRYFAKAFVNRVWAAYFGIGIIDPPDDINPANPPSNKALLDYLTKGFVDHGYDMRWLHREIANSRTYQLSWKPNDTNRLDNHNFSHAKLRRLPAEVIRAALHRAVASSNRPQADVHESHREAFLAETYLLEIFGKPTDSTNCECDRSSSANLLQTIYLHNDREMQSLLDNAKWIRELAAARTSADPADVIQEAYLRTLSRYPTDEETKIAADHLRSASDISSGVRDLLWVLFNSKEFLIAR